jgi:hypothetical protein
VGSATGNPNGSDTVQVEKQVPCSFCHVVVRRDVEVKGCVLYRGENAVEKFLENLQDELGEIREVLKHPDKMYLDDDDRKVFLKTTECHTGTGHCSRTGTGHCSRTGTGHCSRTVFMSI